MTDSRSVLDGLQAQAVACLRQNILINGKDVALLDFPRHQNAGDSLIWQGERAYLSEMGVTIRYSSDLHCFSATELRRRVPTGTILITGGGNFGDRWSEHHDFRLRVLQDFPDYPIVQLPQSLDFVRASAANETRQVMQDHPRFVLLLRDRIALATARRLFPAASLEWCPDMALGAGLLPRLMKPEFPVLYLLRDDSESVFGELPISTEKEVRSADWALSRRGNLQYRMLRLPEDAVRLFPLLERPARGLISRSLESIANLNVLEARQLLSGAEVVVTDRLHAMILAVLSGIPVVALNNANGKVKAIFDDYLSDFPAVFLADDPLHAESLSRELAGIS